MVTINPSNSAQRNIRPNKKIMEDYPAKDLIKILQKKMGALVVNSKIPNLGAVEAT